jgi:hypothetical protein
MLNANFVDLGARWKRVFEYASVGNAFQLGSNECRTLARLYVQEFYDLKNIRIVVDAHAIPDI